MIVFSCVYKLRICVASVLQSRRKYQYHCDMHYVLLVPLSIKFTMAHYTPNEIVDMLLVLGECRYNYKEAARLYRDRFPRRRHPSNMVI